MHYSHFFSKKFQHICVLLDVNFNELLTNDIVSFEQLGQDVYIVNRETLPKLYGHLNNAWVTAAIFQDWFLKDFVQSMKKTPMQKKKFPVKAGWLMDNCGAHPKDLISRDGKITILFLLRNIPTSSNHATWE